MSTFANMPSRLAGTLKRAFRQFLAVPLSVVIGFVALTVVIYFADQAWSLGHTPTGFTWLGDMLGDSTSLATLLGTIASSIITVASITFSLLLIALQQGSSSFTSQVTDQFLMRRSNQFYFGYFVGLSVFVLLSLVTASKIHRPVFGASIIVVLTIVALCMLVVLIYNTIDQMRPTQIVREIHAHILAARVREAALLSATRRKPRPDWPVAGILRSTEAGHVIAVDVLRLRAAVAAIGCGDVEAELRIPVGQFLAFGDPLVTLRMPSTQALPPAVMEQVRQAIGDAVIFDDARDLRQDPSLGIEQLAVIAWTSASTARSDPGPAQAVIQSLRDILARWSAEGGEVAGDDDSLVVIGDVAPGQIVVVFEHIIMAASESMQAQSLVLALRSLVILLETATGPLQAQIADVARRSLSCLGEHVLTRDLEAALAELVVALKACGFSPVGEQVEAAAASLATTLGVLNSRSTRVPASNT